MQDGDNFDDVVLVKEVHREWEPPHDNASNVHEDLWVHQRRLRGSFYRGIQLEKELDP
jgi:hypothetical protein